MFDVVETTAACRELSKPCREPNEFDRWLAGNAGTELLRPAPNDYLQTWAVSKRVNSSRAPDDDPTLIDRVSL